MENDFKSNGDIRVDAIVHALCNFYGLCDPGCEHLIDHSLVAAIVSAIDQADQSNGIVRVPEKPGHTQLMAGLRCAMKGESPSMTYREMVKEGIKSLNSPADLV
jgi:hypothetical protein